MIDPTLRSGDNIIINFFAKSHQAIKMTENDDGSVYSLRPIKLTIPLTGTVKNVWRHPAHPEGCLLEVFAPGLQNQLILIDDLQNCFVSKQV